MEQQVITASPILAKMLWRERRTSESTS